MALLKAFSSIWRPHQVTRISQAGLSQPKRLEQHANYAAVAAPWPKKKSGPAKKDKRVSRIRYFLNHPITPRPLRFSRLRYLRHWTIHRAWQLYQSKLREKRKTERYQQFQSMSNACEALRNMDAQGFTALERAKNGLPPAQESSFGRLYRVAMQKRRVWEGIPIEYARIQTETPPRDGWNHGWTR